MIKEYNGRIWENDNDYNTYMQNVKKYMQISLAIEDYEDCCGINLSDENAFVLLKNFRKSKNNLTNKELLNQSTEIVEKLEELLTKIGRDNFTFYEDDDTSINFNWDKYNK